MIVECIKEAPPNAIYPGCCAPIKGCLYEVVCEHNFDDSKPEFNPYYILREIPDYHTHLYFRKVDINIEDATTKILNELPIEVLL